LSAVERGGNPFPDALNVRQDFVIPQPQYSIASRFEKTRAPLIRFRALGMLSPIQFNHQPPLRTAEIDDEGTDIMLTAKLRSTKLSAA